MTAPENRESAVQDFRNMTGASAEQVIEMLQLMMPWVGSR